jgi:hypothetical protein
MPSGPAGSRDASFTLYDGTQLRWTGSALEVDSNPRPRTIELRAPDGSTVHQHIEGPTATLTP